jgi:predicted dithiol-disulfide oxidoreductase (DUF899 family)
MMIPLLSKRRLKTGGFPHKHAGGPEVQIPPAGPIAPLTPPFNVDINLSRLRYRPPAHNETPPGTNRRTTMLHNRIVSREEWLDARRAHLAREKALTREQDRLNEERRALPWMRVDTAYTFQTPQGPQSLAALFGPRSQLITYHFMLAPGWEAGCTGCSFGADHFDGMLPHLEAADARLVAVSRAPLAEIEAYRRRMGWHFPWVSSAGSDFNRDFHVSFPPETVQDGKVDYNFTRTDLPHEMDELHGLSVFYKDAAGDIFHTYSSYARGTEHLLGTMLLLDRVPKGRNEQGTMNWVRRHDEYAEPPAQAAACCHGESLAS